MKLRLTLLGVAACSVALAAVPTTALAATSGSPVNTAPVPTGSVSTGSVSASSTGVKVCNLAPAAVSGAEAATKSGESAATVCSLYGAASSSSPAASAADPNCGSLVVQATPNDPYAGWFHEGEYWYAELTDFLENGIFTAGWANFTTGGGNQFSWYPTLEWSDWSGEHNVYSRGGTVGVNTFGSAVISTGIEGQIDCTYPVSNTVEISVR